MKNNRNYVSVTLPHYLSIVNYLHANNFRYCTNNKTGNKAWKDKDNQIVAKRIVDKGDNDIYLVKKSFLQAIKR